MDTALGRTFGTLLKQYREAAGFTQEELAERAQMSVRGLIYLEREERRPYPHTVQRLGEALALAPPDRVSFTLAARRSRASAAVQPPSTRPSPAIPVPLTPLVGREAEVAEVAALLQRADIRQVTLTGPGGVGKTRLALEVAADLANMFADGAVFVSLAPLKDATLMAATIAQTLGVREAPVRPLAESLTAHLREQQMLLLLDNLEHLLAAVGLVADLLAACPHLKVLATSRAVLRIQGEHGYTVSPLAWPDPGRLPAVDELQQFPAIELFVQRASASKPGFQLTSANASAVGAICARLDGLPLALELAAARVALLPPDMLLTRLLGAYNYPLLRVLAGGARHLPARLQTMHNAIAWSYDLLEPETQALFRRLAVFVGGCTLDAAEAICPLEGELGAEILDGVTDLVEQSLLRGQEQPDEIVRLVMLETIREYARERLEESGDEAQLRRQHAAFFLRLAEEAEPQLTGPQQEIWLARLEWEHDNMRAALNWAQESQANGAALLGLRLAGALQRFWEMHGHLGEGRGWIEGLLARPECAREATAAVRAKALKGAARLAWAQGDCAHAEALGERSLDLYRTVGDTRGSAAVFNLLGLVAQARGDFKTTTALYSESLTLCRELDDRRGIAAALNNLGEVARVQGEQERAAALYEESLALFRTLPDKLSIADVLIGLGSIMLDQGMYERAMALYAESLTLFWSVGSHWGVAYGLEGVAAGCARGGQPERAVRLCAAAQALREVIGTPLLPADRASYDRTIAATRSALDVDAWTAAWAAGQALSTAQAIAEALADTRQ